MCDNVRYYVKEECNLVNFYIKILKEYSKKILKEENCFLIYMFMFMYNICVHMCCYGIAEFPFDRLLEYHHERGIFKKHRFVEFHFCFRIKKHFSILLSSSLRRIEKLLFHSVCIF